jgi:nucleotide-binding universal stress UspA family protein
MFKRVLIAFDGSPCSREALKVGAGLVGETAGHGTICFALDFGDVPFVELFPIAERAAIRGDAHRYANDLVEDAKASLAGAGGAFDSYIVEGQPPAAIVQAATDLHCDLIVMGTHGRKGLERALLGSVAEGVTRSSPIPVLTVRAT